MGERFSCANLDSTAAALSFRPANASQRGDSGTSLQNTPWRLGYIYLHTCIQTLRKTGSIRGVKFNPNQIITKMTKTVVKFENFTNITQREWHRRKKWYPTRVCLTFEDPTKKRVYGARGGTSKTGIGIWCRRPFGVYRYWKNVSLCYLINPGENIFMWVNVSC